MVNDNNPKNKIKANIYNRNLGLYELITQIKEDLKISLD